MNNLKVDTSIKGILLLTIPISLAKLIPELNYLFNAVFLGHLGSMELALAGITGVYYLVFSAIGYGLNNALISIMSRRAGEESRDEIFSTFWHGIILALILAMTFIGLTWLSISHLFVYSGIEQKGGEMAASFLQIRIVGLIFLYTLQMQSAFLISIQQTKYLIIIALIQSFINVTLDYILIFGWKGVPALGFNGAAYASVISELVGMLVIILIIKYKRLLEKFKIAINLEVQIIKLKKIFIQGLPLMSQLAISTGAWWIFYILISRNFDYNDQAISQTMRNLFGLSGVFSWAFGSSANTIISNLIGQGKVNDMFLVIKKMYKITFMGMLILVIFLNLFPEMFFKLFGQNEDFTEAGRSVLWIVSVAMLILCIGVIWLNAVVATGQTKIVFWIEFIGISSYLLYVWYVIEIAKCSLEVAWMSEWIYWSVLFLLSYLYLTFGNWRSQLLQ